MIKEKLFNFIFILFIGTMITYVHYTPPYVVYKHKNVTSINHIEYVDEKDELEEAYNNLLY
jgi:hypothetical protein